MTQPLPDTAWHARLLAIVSGADAVVDIERIGGIEQYVLATLRQSGDAATGRVALDAGLDRLFTSESLLSLKPAAASHLLDLAAAFKPAAAVPQLLAFLQEHVRRPIEHQFGRRGIDLRARALQALEAYFPAPPLHDSPAFAAYKRVLETYTDIPGVQGYATARRSELEGDVFGDLLVIAALRAMPPQELADVIRRVVARNTNPIAERYLGAIRRALFPGRTDQFVTAVQILGGTVAPAEGGSAAVHLPGDITLILPSDLLSAGATLQQTKRSVLVQLRTFGQPT